MKLKINRPRSAAKGLNKTDYDTLDNADVPEPAGENDLAMSSDDDGDKPPGAGPAQRRRALASRQPVTVVLIAILAMACAGIAGFFKWYVGQDRAAQSAATESVRAATAGAIAMLSYRPESVDHDLGAARNLLAGTFQGSYSTLTHDVVIPGAREKKITAQATVPAASSVSADQDRAVVLLYINQTTTVGSEPPTAMASCVRVTLDHTDGRWLITGFDPI